MRPRFRPPKPHPKSSRSHRAESLSFLPKSQFFLKKWSIIGYISEPLLYNSKQMETNSFFNNQKKNQLLGENESNISLFENFFKNKNSPCFQGTTDTLFEPFSTNLVKKSFEDLELISQDSKPEAFECKCYYRWLFSTIWFLPFFYRRASFFVFTALIL